MVVRQDAAAHGTAGDDQRQERPCLLVADARGARVAARHLLGAGEEGGRPVDQYLSRGGHVGVQRQPVEPVDDVLVVAAVAGDPQAAGVGGGQHQAVGAERGQDHVADEVDDVPDGDGLRQGGREVHQLVQPACLDPFGGEGRRDARGGGRRRCAAVAAVRGRSPRDAYADAAGVGIEVEAQPGLRGAQGGEGDRVAADDGGAVVVLDDGVVQPGQGLPRTGAPQVVAVPAQQLRGRRGQVRDPSFQVEGDRALRQAFEVVGGGLRVLGAAGGGTRRAVRGGADRAPSAGVGSRPGRGRSGGPSRRCGPVPVCRLPRGGWPAT